MTLEWCSKVWGHFYDNANMFIVQTTCSVGIEQHILDTNAGKQLS